MTSGSSGIDGRGPRAGGPLSPWYCVGRYHERRSPETCRAGASRRQKDPQDRHVHGDLRVDDYVWLRGKDDPEVLAYLRAENAYADAVMKPTAALADTLYDEMLARIKEDDQTVPYRRGAYFYYSRTEKGKQYPILCRKPGSWTRAEEVMLDLNALAEGHPFFGLGMAR